MAGKRHDQGRVCLCDRPDGSCAGLAVRRLSQDRVRELAEEIWTASSGLLAPVRRPRRPAVQPGRRLRPRRLPAPPRAGAGRLAAGPGLAMVGDAGRPLLPGCGGCDRRRLAGLGRRPWRRCWPGRGCAFAPLPRPALEAAGGHAAPHRRGAWAPGARGLPGAARRHPAGMAGQPGAPGGRPDRRLGGRVLAAPAAAARRRCPAREPAAACAGRPRPWPRSWTAGPVPVRPLLCVHGPGRSGPGPPHGVRVAAPASSPTSSATAPGHPPATLAKLSTGCSRCCDRQHEMTLKHPKACRDRRATLDRPDLRFEGDHIPRISSLLHSRARPLAMARCAEVVSSSGVSGIATGTPWRAG